MDSSEPVVDVVVKADRGAGEVDVYREVVVVGLDLLVTVYISLGEVFPTRVGLHQFFQPGNQRLVDRCGQFENVGVVVPCAGGTFEVVVPVLNFILFNLEGGDLEWSPDCRSLCRCRQ